MLKIYLKDIFEVTWPILVILLTCIVLLCFMLSLVEYFASAKDPAQPANNCFLKHLIRSAEMTAMSLTTMGFGDVKPSNGWGRLICLVQAFLGIFIFGYFVGIFSALTFKCIKE